MKTRQILFLAALVAAACTKEAPVSEQVIRFRVDAPATVQTKVTQESDGNTPSGLVFKWESDDKLCLNFEYGGSYYPVEAAIDAATISADGKEAEFTVTVPSAIPADATFNVYAIYQKEHTWVETSNRRWNKSGTDPDVFSFAEDAFQGTTLDTPGSCGAAILRPAFYGEQKSVTASTLSSFALSHLGWVMCVHFRNKTTGEIDVPNQIKFSAGVVLFGNSYSLSSGPSGQDQTLKLSLAEYTWNPWSGKTIAAGVEQVYYRWVCSPESVSALSIEVSWGSTYTAEETLPARTATPGKVYHVYLNWDGSKVTIGK